MIEIDPVETIVQWLKESLTTVEERVAAKHRYGSGWQTDKNGVSVHADGGPHDRYAPVINQRFELRLYADGTVPVMEIWQELISLSRDNERFLVTTSAGSALVHYFYPETGLSFLYDDILKKDVGVVFFTSLISEEA